MLNGCVIRATGAWSVERRQRTRGSSYKSVRDVACILIPAGKSCRRGVLGAAGRTALGILEFRVHPGGAANESVGCADGVHPLPLRTKPCTAKSLPTSYPVMTPALLMSTDAGGALKEPSAPEVVSKKPAGLESEIRPHAPPGFPFQTNKLDIPSEVQTLDQRCPARLGSVMLDLAALARSFPCRPS